VTWTMAQEPAGPAKLPMLAGLLLNLTLRKLRSYSDSLATRQR
jgi:hypothetical protein